MPKRLSVTLFLLISSLIVIISVKMFESNAIEKDLRAQYLKAGDFVLQHDNQPFDTSDLRGAPYILYFGYTYCPDVCPVGLSVIREVLLSDASFQSIPALFVTLDPFRDTTERLKEYVDFFHPNIVALRGEIEGIKTITSAYGAFFRSSQNEDEKVENYTVDHSAYYYLVDEEGQLVRVLDHDATASQISELLHKLI